MSYSGFVLICVIALIAYYAYQFLRPTKKEFSPERKDGFKPSNIIIEPPVSVTLDMVSFSPTVLTEETESEISDVVSGEVSSNINKYEHYSTFSDSLLDKIELSSFVTKEAIKEGELLFSNILI